MSCEEVRMYEDVGVVGFVFGFFFDVDGKIIISEFDVCYIIMLFDDFMNVFECICVGGGVDKIEVICVFLWVKFVNILVIDEVMVIGVRKSFKV